MIRITIFEREKGVYTGFRMEGHAGYAEYGNDIVCAAVSVLVINTINALERFTGDDFEHAIHQEEDVVSLEMTSVPVSSDAELLLKTLVLGLQAIEEEYGKTYIRVKFKKAGGVREC